MHEIDIMLLQCKMDELLFFRPLELEMCKTQEERERLKDRWAIKDAAEEISNAIRSTSYSRHKFLGIF